jgi:hypothetical protein
MMHIRMGRNRLVNSMQEERRFPALSHALPLNSLFHGFQKTMKQCIIPF